MKPQLVLTPQAQEDLLEVFVTIALDNEAAAERVTAAIEKQVLRLTDFPRLGRRWQEIRPSTRILVQGMYLILYEIHPDTEDGPVETVEIVRIVHGNRDLSHII